MADGTAWKRTGRLGGSVACRGKGFQWLEATGTNHEVRQSSGTHHIQGNLLRQSLSPAVTSPGSRYINLYLLPPGTLATAINVSTSTAHPHSPQGTSPRLFTRPRH
ncbi:hypothetical protein CGMCC3_g1012 [Colletotrichum fructicola]|nr:uncharacterized protein CGMCC3_g1012 [Colletotrichum fructicola]KAE9582974.1 hypothetical protein CGMCC3_g1012 [Colletotrichum fructicola]